MDPERGPAVVLLERHGIERDVAWRTLELEGLDEALGEGSPWNTPWNAYSLPSSSRWTKRQVPPSRTS
jgi:hypothetical protein